MKLPNWFSKMLNRKSQKEILAQIDEHHQITIQTNEALDKMIAALDGESEWFDCNCIQKPYRRRKTDHGSLSDNARSQCHS